MILNEKYCSVSEKDVIENKDKKVLSEDAFALCDFLEQLIRMIDHKGGLK